MATYRRCPAVTWRRLRNGVILAVPGSTDALQLNATGAVLWDLLDEPADPRSITSRLAAAFDRSVPEVIDAVGPLLDELESCGAVERL